VVEALCYKLADRGSIVLRYVCFEHDKNVCINGTAQICDTHLLGNNRTDAQKLEARISAVNQFVSE
jgi:hypothetical protein